MGRRLPLSIRDVAGLIGLAAIGSAWLAMVVARRHQELWGLTLGLLVWATVVAALRRGLVRAFAIGTALGGWAYLTADLFLWFEPPTIGLLKGPDMREFWSPAGPLPSPDELRSITNSMARRRRTAHLVSAALVAVASGLASATLLYLWTLAKIVANDQEPTEPPSSG